MYKSISINILNSILVHETFCVIKREVNEVKREYFAYDFIQDKRRVVSSTKNVFRWVKAQIACVNIFSYRGRAAV